MNQQYQQLDPVRSHTSEESADLLKAKASRTSNGVNQKTIEMLKAARNQVMQAPLKTTPLTGQVNSRNESQNPRGASFGARNKFAPLETHNEESKGQQLSKNTADKFLTGFAEEFVQKLASIEQETAAVDEETAKAEKLWSSLVEKKKQLEARRSELVKVKDKLKELDKEMSEVLKSQSI